LLALSIRRSGRSWLAFAAVALVAVLFERHCWIVASFLPGMLAAEAATRPRVAAWFERHGNALIFAGCALLLGAVVLAPRTFLTLEHGPRLDVAPQLLALCTIFAGIVLGTQPNVLWQLNFRYLGAISYSVYLFHAIVLYVASRVLSAFVPIATLAPVWYWLFVFACVPAVVALSTCSYRLLEAPFLHKPDRRRQAA
jgi:peptidoglycan/LPS O-acetylase OafA/YrhL